MSLVSIFWVAGICLNYTVQLNTYTRFCLFFPATRTVQTNAHTASKEEEQAQAQTPSTTGPITTRYDINYTYTLTNTNGMQPVFRPLSRFFLMSQKLHQTLIPRRRRKRGTTIPTARKRRKTRKRRR